MKSNIKKVNLYDIFLIYSSQSFSSVLVFYLKKKISYLIVQALLIIIETHIK